MNVLIIQPPLVQLNTPYPSGAYLSSFFTALQHRELPPVANASVAQVVEQASASIANVSWKDTGCALFHRLFSRDGLTRLFEETQERAEALIAKYDAHPDTKNAAAQITRYCSTRKNWIDWIDTIVRILEGTGREEAHAFVRSPYTPRGSRIDDYLSQKDGIQPSVDDARILASLAVEDLADYITAVYDPQFSLVRYAESIATSLHCFADVESALSAPVLTNYYEPLLQEMWEQYEVIHQNQQLLLCITVPFPGCLTASLATALSAKMFFKNRVTVVMGGGYVNTELRDITSLRFFDYVDYLSFDRGYGSLAAITATVGNKTMMEQPLYNTVFRSADNSLISALSNADARVSDSFRAWEDSVTAYLVPDFSAIDFSQYPRLADSTNPMHRLWSDGAWLKAYLAHGCYWHNCSFCDVQLDYICGYKPVDVQRLYEGLLAQAQSTGIYGIHFVDEALPPAALKMFALENIKHGTPLLFWGNIRFEKAFTRDCADLLARGGLAGVSGGIEIATEKGFKSVGKGIDLETLVCAAAAFKEAGVLVHSYLIYGYWNETASDIVDSMETMRQLFSAGLIDSAFWHKFVLTRHSRVFREWRDGGHTDLRPVIPASDFANNDCDFAGSDSSAQYTAPLDTSLDAWMNGQFLDEPVQRWFPFKMPKPSVSSDLVDCCIAVYEETTSNLRSQPYDAHDRYVWTAGVPILATDDNGKSCYIVEYMGESVLLNLSPELAAVLVAAAQEVCIISDNEALALCSRKVFKKLRHCGLARV